MDAGLGVARSLGAVTQLVTEIHSAATWHVKAVIRPRIDCPLHYSTGLLHPMGEVNTGCGGCPVVRLPQEKQNRNIVSGEIARTARIQGYSDPKAAVQRLDPVALVRKAVDPPCDQPMTPMRSRSTSRAGGNGSRIPASRPRIERRGNQSTGVRGRAGHANHHAPGVRAPYPDSRSPAGLNACAPVSWPGRCMALLPHLIDPLKGT